MEKKTRVALIILIVFSLFVSSNGKSVLDFLENSLLSSLTLLLGLSQIPDEFLLRLSYVDSINRFFEVFWSSIIVNFLDLTMHILWINTIPILFAWNVYFLKAQNRVLQMVYRVWLFLSLTSIFYIAENDRLEQTPYIYLILLGFSIILEICFHFMNMRRALSHKA